MIYRNWLGIIGVACILFVSCKPTEVDVPITYYSSFLLKDTTVMLSKVEMDPHHVPNKNKAQTESSPITKCL